MFRKLSDFIGIWENHVAAVEKLLAALTDESLAQQVTGEHRTLGRIAWHITQSIVEMSQKTGLTVEGPGDNAPVPLSAAKIKDAYSKASRSLIEQLHFHWTDETLEVTDNMYGRP